MIATPGPFAVGDGGFIGRIRLSGRRTTGPYGLTCKFTA